MAIEYTTTPSAEVPETKPATVAPIPADDLERRLQMLKAAGVREYHDGLLRIAFEPKRSPSSADDAEMLKQVMALAEQERAAYGG